MALTFYSDTKESISFKDFIKDIKEKIKFGDEDSLLSCKDLLFKLTNNKTFLSELINDSLSKDIHAFQENNSYSEQSIMLYDCEVFFVRATYWPKLLKNKRVRKSHNDVFSYGMIHDHNFPLLTAGYIGSGYVTRLWEYNYNDIIGYPGEKVDIKFLEETSLHPGKIIYYRPSKDIHCQLPPENTESVAINLILRSPQHITNKQFEFNIKEGTIKRILDSTLSHWLNLIRLSTFINTKKTRIELEKIANNNPIPKVRLEAIKALNNISKTSKYWEIGLRDKDEKVKKYASYRLNKV
ncbi:MAG: hypothetical protein MK202_06145 [Tenacibaculum sp.]|nr:hypothetical protein [Tenacibaculum sp.]